MMVPQRFTAGQVPLVRASTMRRSYFIHIWKVEITIKIFK